MGPPAGRYYFALMPCGNRLTTVAQTWLRGAQMAFGPVGDGESANAIWRGLQGSIGWTKARIAQGRALEKQGEN